MEERIKEWTKEEFKAYFLLYAANADQIETAEEKEFILSKVDKQTYESIHIEFDADNDYQSIQKLLSAAKKHMYSKDDLEVLMQDIKKLFLADGDYSSYERNLLATLKMLFK